MGCTLKDEIRAQVVRRRAGQQNQAKERGTALETLSDEILTTLAPVGQLQNLCAGLVIAAAWELQSAHERETRRETEPGAAPSKRRDRNSAVQKAAKALREAFETYQACRAALPRPSSCHSSFHLKNPTTEEPMIASNEWPVLPMVEVSHSQWRDRLVLDPEVSEHSPVVKGTWVTASHVVSLIIDGWAWSDILRSHPELTEDDIRSCVSFAMEEEEARV